MTRSNKNLLLVYIMHAVLARPFGCTCINPSEHNRDIKTLWMKRDKTPCEIKKTRIKYNKHKTKKLQMKERTKAKDKTKTIAH